MSYRRVEAVVVVLKWWYPTKSLRAGAVLGLSAIAGLGASVVIATAAAAPNTPHVAPPAPPPALSSAPSPQNSDVPGIAAIRPSLPDSGPQSPRISNADAAAFVMAHPPSETNTGAVRVSHVDFVTAAQLKTEGWDTGLADQRLLCRVQIEGTFTFPAPPGWHTRSGSVVYELFDARTGNLLLLKG